MSGGGQTAVSGVLAAAQVVLALLERPPQPTHLAVVFDSGSGGGRGKTFRCCLFAEDPPPPPFYPPPFSLIHGCDGIHSCRPSRLMPFSVHAPWPLCCGRCADV